MDDSFPRAAAFTAASLTAPVMDEALRLWPDGKARDIALRAAPGRIAAALDGGGTLSTLLREALVTSPDAGASPRCGSYCASSGFLYLSGLFFAVTVTDCAAGPAPAGWAAPARTLLGA